MFEKDEVRCRYPCNYHNREAIREKREKIYCGAVCLLLVSRCVFLTFLAYLHETVRVMVRDLVTGE
jgi:hypothetical protein